MGWAPGTKTLWTVVNERDLLGDELVPDYFTSVKQGGFYGWPYAYFGQHIDPRVNEIKPELLKQTIVPDVNVGITYCITWTGFLYCSFISRKISGWCFSHSAWIMESFGISRV